MVLLGEVIPKFVLALEGSEEDGLLLAARVRPRYDSIVCLDEISKKTPYS